MNNTKLIYTLFILLIGVALSFNSAIAQEIETGMQSNISGTVVDATTGEPLSDVTVMIADMDQETQTDEEGKFNFENLDVTGDDGNPLDITLEIQHDGYQDFAQRVTPQELNQDLTLELQPKTEDY